MKKWLASFEYGHPALATFEIVRETDKSYICAGVSEQLLGYVYVGRRVSKRLGRVFDTASEALLYLYEQAEEYAKNARFELEAAVLQRDILGRLVRECERQNTEEEG